MQVFVMRLVEAGDHMAWPPMPPLSLRRHRVLEFMLAGTSDRERQSYMSKTSAIGELLGSLK